MEDRGDPEAPLLPLWPEDTVEYRIYLDLATDGVDSLQRLALECNHASRQLSEGHVWHFATFSVRPEGAGGLPPHLIGRTCFRDGTQDEWFVIKILLSLSEQFQDFVISVLDDDGQFLLVEAAHYLEKWMRPEEMRNRVFLHRGCVHIIPKPRSPAHIGLHPVTTPTLSEAVDLVRNAAVDTRASPDIQASISRRIASHTEMSSLHRAHCYLPSLAAHVMSVDPRLVTAACHTLNDRFPEDMQTLKKMSVFSPSNHAMVTADVNFTRLLYAQLVSMRFSSPENVGFSVPISQNPKFKERDLGMKLTCGLEILLQQARERDSTGILGEQHQVRWKGFLKSLRNSGYFLSEIEGSKLYQEKLATAEEYFASSCQHEGIAEERNDPLLLAGQRLSRILQEKDFSEDEMKKRSENLLPPDDDDWMNITEKDLDSMLQNATAHDTERPLPHADSATSSADLQSMVFGMKSFVDKVSSHSGAEFPWSGADPSDSKPVDFNPDAFLDKIADMLALPIVNPDPSDSDLDDYLESDGSSDGGEEEEEEEGCVVTEMSRLMEQMDEELADTAVGRSFEKLQVQSPGPSSGDVGTSSAGGTLEPVDVNFNLVKNLLDSYSSQVGVAGPATNILHSLGIPIPDNDSISK